MSNLVRSIQQALNKAGYGPLTVDGLIGPATKNATKNFQRASGLRVDGIAGPVTRAKLGLGTSTPAPAQSAPRAAPVQNSGNLLAVLAQQKPTNRKIAEIIVHCTATPEGRAVSVDTIRGWHKGQGWKDIGYHYVVHLDGTVEAGRPESQVGSHVKGRNTGTLGVVYVGGVAKDGKTPKDTRTGAQREALMALVRGLITKYPTVKKVSGHNEYAAKACPSFDVRADPLGRLV